MLSVSEEKERDREKKKVERITAASSRRTLTQGNRLTNLKFNKLTIPIKHKWTTTTTTASLELWPAASVCSVGSKRVATATNEYPAML